MNIALTGITGMVGSHLIKKLIEENPEGSPYNIRALIREGSVVEHLKTFEDVDYIIGGLQDRESLAKLVQDVDVLVHLAHFPGPVQAVDELVKVNVNGTFDLLEEAKKAKVKQVVFMSACTVFGQILPSVDKEHPLDENHPVYPSSLYGSIKSSIEGFCHYYQKSRAFDVTILRPVTVYGVRPQLDQKVMGNAEASGKTYHLIDGHIHNLDLGKLIAETIDSFGECEGVMGEDGVPMSNQAALDLGVEFPGQERIVEYIKLIHKLQGEYGGERNIQNW